MTYRGAGGIRLFRFDEWLVVVETSKPPTPPPLIDSSILVSVLPLEWDGSVVVVVVVVSFMGLDRLRRNQAADDEEDDVALMEASN